MHIIWDHHTPISGNSPEMIYDAFDLGPSSVVVLVGPNPPHATYLVQATDDQGHAFTTEAAAMAWGAANEYVPPTPTPSPAPTPGPTVESLQTELASLHEMVDLLVLQSLNPPT